MTEPTPLSRNDVLKHFLEWHADHFDDFSSEINAQLLCLANEAQEALSVASEIAPSEREKLDAIYSTLRGVPEAMAAMVVPVVNEATMAYWCRQVSAALELAAPASATQATVKCPKCGVERDDLNLPKCMDAGCPSVFNCVERGDQ